jgi:Tfp pilus assembly protein PilV
MFGRLTDHGETFIEILITLILLSVGVVFTVTALVTTIHTTTFNRTQAQVNASLASAAEWVKARGWVPCYFAGANLTGQLGQSVVNPAFTVQVSGPTPYPSPSATCDANSGITNSQLESQTITVAVSSSYGAQGSVTVVTRWNPTPSPS